MLHVQSCIHTHTELNSTQMILSAVGSTTVVLLGNVTMLQSDLDSIRMSVESLNTQCDAAGGAFAAICSQIPDPSIYNTGANYTMVRRKLNMCSSECACVTKQDQSLFLSCPSFSFSHSLVWWTDSLQMPQMSLITTQRVSCRKKPRTR